MLRIVLCLLLPTLSVNQSLEILPNKKVVIHDLRSSSNLVSLVCRTQDDLSHTEAGLMWFGPDGRQITATYGSRIFVTDIQESLALKISSPNEEDGGVYTCKGAIRGQALEANVTLEMYRGISVTSPAYQYPIVHSDARIMCQANSSQLMQLTWYKMGWDRIRTGSRYSLESDYMLIKNITLKDDGIYICNIDVTNMGDSKAHYINVTVTIPPEIERHITVVPPTPVEGDNLDIECVARGRPAPLYRFLKNGIPLAPMFVESGRQHLESVSRDDDGVYTCEAKNEGGLVSSSVSLDVRVKPKIEPIGDFKVSENDTFRLECFASGDPKPEVIWRRKGDQVFYKPSQNNNERVYVEEGISQDDEREITEKEWKFSIARTTLILIFTQMRPEDTSDYDCYAQNSVGNWTESTHIDVMHAPYFLGMSEIVHGRVGETSKMTCRATGNPEPVIRWYFKGDKVLSVAPYVIMDDPNAPSNEAISHLVVSVTESNKGDIFGLYTCRTDNRLGSNFMSHHLQEKVKPRIEPIGDFKVSENDTFRLVCFVSGDPKPEVIWRRKGDQVFYKPPQNNNERVYVEEGISQDDEREITEKEGKLSIARTMLTLIFTQMRPEDTSDYDCYAQNSVGNWTETTHIDVMYAPYFLGMSEIVHGRVGETSKMTCRATGNPEPVIRWYFKGDKVLSVAPYVIMDDPNAPINEAISHLVVSVTESNKGDIFGLYTCRTDNRLGSNFMSHHLQEKDVFELTSFDPTPLDLNTVSTESYFHTLRQKPDYGVGKTTILRSEHTKNVISKDGGKGLIDDEVYTTTLDLTTTRKFTTSSSATTFGTNKQEIASKRVQSRISSTHSTVGPLKAATSDKENEPYQATTSVKHTLGPVITSRIATFGKITKRKEVTSESPATSGIKTSGPAKTFRVKPSEITTIGGGNGSGSVTIGRTAASGSNSNIGVHDSEHKFSSGIIASDASSTKSILATKLLTPKGVITSEPLITEAVKASVSITIKGVNASEPSTTKRVKAIESTTTKGFQVSEPTATRVITVSQPSTTKVVKVSEPSTTKVITASEPSTIKVVTISKPSITKVVRASEPSTTKVVRASEPSTTIVDRASEPSTTKVITASEPSATKVVRASETSTTKVVRASEPSTSKVDRASEPSTTKVVTVSKPSTTNEITASELADSNRENTPKQTAISEFQASGLASTKLTVILDSSSNSTVAPSDPAVASKVKTSGSVSTSGVTSFRLVTSREIKRSDLLSTSRVTPFRLATRSEAKTLDPVAARGVESTLGVDISEPSAGSQLRSTTISKLSGLKKHGQVLETHSDTDFNHPFYLQSVASTRISTSIPSTSSGIGQPDSKIDDVEAIPAKDSASGEAHLASLNIFGIIVLTSLQTICS